MRTRFAAVLIIALTAAALLTPTAACSKKAPAGKSGKKAPAKTAAPARKWPDPAADTGPLSLDKDIAWPAPKLQADENFYKREGAHFENNYENWQVAGTLTDDTGRTMDFSALFFKTGLVYMMINHGFAALDTADGYRFASFGPATLRAAAVNDLKRRLQEDPDNKDIPERIARLEAQASPEFVTLTEQAVVLRNSLSLDYGAYKFHRISETQFEYALQLTVQGAVLDLKLSTDRDPAQFEAPYVPVGAAGALDGYAFPHLSVQGTLTSNGVAHSVTGGAMIHHFWGKIDPGAFQRYTLMGLNFQNGATLNTFRFYSPDGTLMTRHNRGPGRARPRLLPPRGPAAVTPRPKSAL